jgi:hypothetical protein
MQKYIDNVLELAKVRGQTSTPATLQLFGVDKEAAVLSAVERQLFHSLVAKLYYLCKRARPDIRPDSSIVPDDQSTGTDSRRLW